MFVALGGIALGLRLFHLDNESLFMDELRQVSYYPERIGRITLLAATQQQPPLDYLIGHFIALVSYSDFAVRLPAALFGSGSVLLIVAILLPVTNPVVAFSAGLIASLLPFNLYCSQYARPYAIAIFFMLLTLYLLDRVVSESNGLVSRLLLLVGAATLFLYSRGHPPLLVLVTLVAILCARLLCAPRAVGGSGRRRVGWAILSLVAAMALYVPMMRMVIAAGKGYVPGLALPPSTMLARGWSAFSLRPVWEAYVTQAEPLGFLLLPLLCVAPLLLFWPRWRGSFMLFCVTLLLPTAALLDAAVFALLIDVPFRPPYPIYILPLCLILAAAAGYWLWVQARSLKGAAALRVLGATLAIGFLALTGRATLAFENTQKHEDWKGLAQYLARTTGPEQLLLFDTVAPQPQWGALFYGSPRYFRGTANLLYMRGLRAAATRLLGSHLEPVVILFEYRNIYLTPYSAYPIVPGSGAGRSEALTPIAGDPELSTRSFTGFLTVRLKTPSGQCVADTLELLERIQRRLTQDASLVELDLSAGALALALGRDEVAAAYLKRAVELAPQGVKVQTMDAVTAIRNSR